MAEPDNKAALEQMMAKRRAALRARGIYAPEPGEEWNPPGAEAAPAPPPAPEVVAPPVLATAALPAPKLQPTPAAAPVSTPSVPAAAPPGLDVAAIHKKMDELQHAAMDGNKYNEEKALYEAAKANGIELTVGADFLNETARRREYNRLQEQLSFANASGSGVEKATAPPSDAFVESSIARMKETIRERIKDEPEAERALSFIHHPRTNQPVLAQHDTFENFVKIRYRQLLAAGKPQDDATLEEAHKLAQTDLDAALHVGFGIGVVDRDPARTTKKIVENLPDIGAAAGNKAREVGGDNIPTDAAAWYLEQALTAVNPANLRPVAAALLPTDSLQYGALTESEVARWGSTPARAAAYVLSVPSAFFSTPLAARLKGLDPKSEAGVDAIRRGTDITQTTSELGNLLLSDEAARGLDKGGLAAYNTGFLTATPEEDKVVGVEPTGDVAKAVVGGVAAGGIIIAEPDAVGMPLGVAADVFKIGSAAIAARQVTRAAEGMKGVAAAEFGHDFAGATVRVKDVLGPVGADQFATNVGLRLFVNEDVGKEVGKLLKQAEEAEAALADLNKQNAAATTAAIDARTQAAGARQQLQDAKDAAVAERATFREETGSISREDTAMHIEEQRAAATVAATEAKLRAVELRQAYEFEALQDRLAVLKQKERVLRPNVQGGLLKKPNQQDTAEMLPADYPDLAGLNATAALTDKGSKVDAIRYILARREAGLADDVIRREVTERFDVSDDSAIMLERAADNRTSWTTGTAAASRHAADAHSPAIDANDPLPAWQKLQTELVQKGGELREARLARDAAGFDNNFEWQLQQRLQRIEQEELAIAEQRRLLQEKVNYHHGMTSSVARYEIDALRADIAARTDAVDELREGLRADVKEFAPHQRTIAKLQKEELALRERVATLHAAVETSNRRRRLAGLKQVAADLQTELAAQRKTLATASDRAAKARKAYISRASVPKVADAPPNVAEKDLPLGVGERFASHAPTRAAREPIPISHAAEKALREGEKSVAAADKAVAAADAAHLDVLDSFVKREAKMAYRQAVAKAIKEELQAMADSMAAYAKQVGATGELNKFNLFTSGVTGTPGAWRMNPQHLQAALDRRYGAYSTTLRASIPGKQFLQIAAYAAQRSGGKLSDKHVVAMQGLIQQLDELYRQQTLNATNRARAYFRGLSNPDMPVSGSKGYIFAVNAKRWLTNRFKWLIGDQAYIRSTRIGEFDEAVGRELEAAENELAVAVGEMADMLEDLPATAADKHVDRILAYVDNNTPVEFNAGAFGLSRGVLTHVNVGPETLWAQAKRQMLADEEDASEALDALARAWLGDITPPSKDAALHKQLRGHIEKSDSLKALLDAVKANTAALAVKVDPMDSRVVAMASTAVLKAALLDRMARRLHRHFAGQLTPDAMLTAQRILTGELGKGLEEAPNIDAAWRALELLGMPFQQQTVKPAVKGAGEGRSFPKLFAQVSTDDTGAALYLPKNVRDAFTQNIDGLIKQLDKYNPHDRSMQSVALKTLYARWKQDVLTGILLPNPKYWVNQTVSNFASVWMEQGVVRATGQTFRTVPAIFPFVFGRRFQDVTSQMAAAANGQPILGGLLSSLFNPHIAKTFQGSEDYIRLGDELVQYKTLLREATEDGILDSMASNEFLDAFSRSSLRATGLGADWKRALNQLSEDVGEHANLYEQRQRLVLYLEERSLGKGRKVAQQSVKNAFYDWRHGFTQWELAYATWMIPFYRYNKLAMKQAYSALLEPFVRPLGEHAAASVLGDTKLNRLKQQHLMLKLLPNWMHDVQDQLTAAEEDQSQDILSFGNLFFPDYVGSRPRLMAPIGAWRNNQDEPFLYNGYRVRGKDPSHLMVTAPEFGTLAAAEMWFAPFVFMGMAGLAAKSDEYALGAKPTDEMLAIAFGWPTGLLGPGVRDVVQGFFRGESPYDDVGTSPAEAVLAEKMGLITYNRDGAPRLPRYAKFTASVLLPMMAANVPKRYADAFYSIDKNINTNDLHEVSWNTARAFGPLFGFGVAPMDQTTPITRVQADLRHTLNEARDAKNGPTNLDEPAGHEPSR